MFRAMRTAAAVRALLGLAALLTLGSSVGLHPEPAAAQDLSAAEVGAPTGTDFVPHRCLACLTFGSTLVTPLPATLAAGDCLEHAAFSFEPARVTRIAEGGISGRSPPALA
jgi:hypothetical protein